MHPGELTRLVLIVSKISDEDASNESIVLNSRILHPLLSFKGLSHLDLGHLCTAHIDMTYVFSADAVSPNITEFHVGASPIGNHVKVTTVLSFLFPSVTHINHPIPNGLILIELQERRGNWDTVNMWLEAFVSARKESRQQGWLEGNARVKEDTVA